MQLVYEFCFDYLLILPDHNLVGYLLLNGLWKERKKNIENITHERKRNSLRTSWFRIHFPSEWWILLSSKRLRERQEKKKNNWNRFVSDHEMKCHHKWNKNEKISIINLEKIFFSFFMSFLGNATISQVTNI